MRYLRYLSIAIFAVALIAVALANSEPVTIKVLPDGLANFAAVNPSYTVPLFVVIFAGILAGLIIGFIWEWIREAGERAEAIRTKTEMERLRAEVRRLKTSNAESSRDEVMLMLEKAS